MEHEKNCDCQHDNCCGNLEDVKTEITEVINNVTEKIAEVKDQAVDYAQEHELKDKAESMMQKAGDFVSDAKEKYEQSSPETKAKIKKGVAQGAMALGALLILKKIFGRKK